jgi:hypothetical protein
MPFIQQQLIADGVTAAGRVVVPKAVLEIITNDHVATMAVNVGGTGYAVGDTFRLNTGVPVALNGVDFHATGRVVSEAGGVVTGVQIVSAGAYTTPPPGNSTVTLTGAGTGLTITNTNGTPLWTQDFSDYTTNLVTFDWLASSVKAANAPTIGLRGELSASNDGMRLQIASSYDNLASWISQPGSPPTNLFYCNLPNQDPEIFVSVTERRVNILITDDGRNNKQYCSAGLFVPYVDVATNYPFPGFVAAQSTTVRAFTESFNTANQGVVHPINFGSPGAYQYRNNLSAEWFGITSDNGTGTQVGAGARGLIWPYQNTAVEYSLTHAPVPTGSAAPSSTMNPYNSTNAMGSLREDDTQGWFNSADSTIHSQGPAPLGIGSQLHFTVQPHIIAGLVSDVQVVGYIDGWEAVHGRGLAAFEEIETAAGRRYLVFNDTDSTALQYWVAMEII